MDYSNYTREQLIVALEECEMLERELLAEKEKETSLDYGWTGNLGHWYWNIKTNSVVFNPLKVIALGYNRNELPRKVNFEFFTERLHPDDYQHVMQAMRLHMYGQTKVYEVDYRIQAKDKSYKWFYDLGKVTQRWRGQTPFCFRDCF